MAGQPHEPFRDQQRTPLRVALRRELPAALLYALSAHLIVIILLLNSVIQIRTVVEAIPPHPFPTTIVAANQDLPEQQPDAPEEAAEEGTSSSELIAALPEIPSDVIEVKRPSEFGDTPPPPEVIQKTPPAEATASADLLKLLAANDGGSGAGLEGSGLEYAGRSGTARTRGLRAHGGSHAGEAAVEAGLAWLASVQDRDDLDDNNHGRWDILRFARHYLRPSQGQKGISLDRYLNEGGKDKRSSLGLTALVLLAFTGHGESADAGPYADHVSAGLAYLRRHQDHKGAFNDFDERGLDGNLYDHSLALLVLADHAAMTQSKSDLKVIQKGVDLLEGLQQAAGGWDYYITNAFQRKRSDLSVTGFAAMALVAAKSAGAVVDDAVLQRIVNLLKASTTPSGAAIYVLEDLRTGYTMTSVNLFLRLLLGQAPDDPTQKKQLALITDKLPDYAEAAKFDRDPYAWYYTSLAMLIGGASKDQQWLSYNAAMQRSLVEAQEKDGVRAGSWPPTTYYSELEGGRVYATAIAVLCLECYYRYQPAAFSKSAKKFAKFWK